MNESVGILLAIRSIWVAPRDKLLVPDMFLGREACFIVKNIFLEVDEDGVYYSKQQQDNCGSI
jgi:hypothetical protein